MPKDRALKSFSSGSNLSESAKKVKSHIGDRSWKAEAPGATPTDSEVSSETFLERSIQSCAIFKIAQPYKQAQFSTMVPWPSASEWARVLFLFVLGLIIRGLIVDIDTMRLLLQVRYISSSNPPLVSD